MPLRLVKDIRQRPARCACLALMTNSNEPVGFFDFGTETFGGDHVYVSWTAFRQMAEYAGYGSTQLHRAALQAERDLRAEAESKLANAEKALAAVQVLKSTGFEQARRPGRPKNAEKNAEKVPA